MRNYKIDSKIDSKMISIDKYNSSILMYTNDIMSLYIKTNEKYLNKLLCDSFSELIYTNTRIIQIKEVLNVITCNIDFILNESRDYYIKYNNFDTNKSLRKNVLLKVAINSLNKTSNDRILPKYEEQYKLYKNVFNDFMYTINELNINYNNIILKIKQIENSINEYRNHSHLMLNLVNTT